MKLSLDQFKKIHNEIDKETEEVVLLDLRSKSQLKSIDKALIPKSVCVMNDSPFERLLGNLLFAGSNYLLVLPQGQEQEMLNRLKVLRYSNILGYIHFNDWKNNKEPLDSFIEKSTLDEGEHVIDVREKFELARGISDYPHVSYINLRSLNCMWKSLDTTKNYTTLCGGGARSIVAMSYLMSKGLKVSNLKGGFNQLAKLGFKIIHK